MSKIERKPKDPAPGDIDNMIPWKKINTRRNEQEGVKFSAFKREIFTDTYCKQRNWLAGPGKFHVDTHKYDKLSKSPPSISKKRH